MIGKLKGKIESCDSGSIIIDVGGVGYLVYVSSKTLATTKIGEVDQLYIETHVREDAIKLFGFINKEEQDCFNLLQSVKGVGTRMALAILSHLSPNDIALALSAEDKDAFNNVNGVGKKLAERIITELKDKFANHISHISNNKGNNNNLDQSNNIISDSVMALTSLGINRSDAYSRVQNILNNNPGCDINDIIKLALQNKSQR